MDKPILITGASGNVGRSVVQQLLARGASVRYGGGSHERVPDAVESVAHLDFTDATTFARAVAGCGGMFLLRPPAIARVGPTLNRLVDVARDAGLEHVVFLSVAGAESNRIVPHHRVEQHLVASGLSYTILRPGFFADNLVSAYREDIAEGRIYVPAGAGRVAFVDARDLGEVAAIALVEPAAHVNAAYHLTGPEAITFSDVARLLTERLGRPVRYEPAGILGYARHLRRRRLPASQILVQTVLHVGLRRGDAEAVDLTICQLLGRSPRTMEAFIADHYSSSPAA